MLAGLSYSVILCILFGHPRSSIRTILNIRFYKNILFVFKFFEHLIFTNESFISSIHYELKKIIKIIISFITKSIARSTQTVLPTKPVCDARLGEPERRGTRCFSWPPGQCQQWATDRKCKFPKKISHRIVYVTSNDMFPAFTILQEKLKYLATSSPV